MRIPLVCIRKGSGSFFFVPCPRSFYCFVYNTTNINRKYRSKHKRIRCNSTGSWIWLRLCLFVLSHDGFVQCVCRFSGTRSHHQSLNKQNIQKKTCMKWYFFYKENSWNWMCVCVCGRQGNWETRRYRNRKI